MFVDAEPVRVPPETTDRNFGWTVVEVAEMLGGDRERAHARFRGLVRHGYVHPVALFTGDRRGAYLYGEGEVFTAAALGRLCDHGFKNHHALAHAALALNDFIGWPDGAPPLRSAPSIPAPSPAEWIIDGYRTGVAGWALEVATFRQGENVIHAARLRNPFAKIGTDWTMSGEGFEKAALTVIDLDDVLVKLFGVVRAPGAATH